jgi:6-phosphogluconolactonase (cycloisomerase 2 family)
VHSDLEEVSAYAIDKQNGHITALNRQSCGGKNAVHPSIDPTGRWIVTANYSAGTVGVVPIEKDGTLPAASSMHRTADTTASRFLPSIRTTGL